MQESLHNIFNCNSKREGRIRVKVVWRCVGKSLSGVVPSIPWDCWPPFVRHPQTFPWPSWQTVTSWRLTKQNQNHLKPWYVQEKKALLDTAFCTVKSGWEKCCQEQSRKIWINDFTVVPYSRHSTYLRVQEQYSTCVGLKWRGDWRTHTGKCEQHCNLVGVLKCYCD